MIDLLLMGICASSPLSGSNNTFIKDNSSKNNHRDCNGSETTAGETAKVLHVNGKMREYGRGTSPVTVLAGNPGYYICSSESMHVGEHVPPVDEADELLPGHIYFLLPLVMAKRPLSLSDLCELAVAASKALRLQDYNRVRQEKNIRSNMWGLSK